MRRDEGLGFTNLFLVGSASGLIFSGVTEPSGNAYVCTFRYWYIQGVFQGALFMSWGGGFLIYVYTLER